MMATRMWALLAACFAAATLPPLETLLNRDELALVTLGFLLVAGFLLRVARREQRRVRNATLLFAFALLLLMAAWIAGALGHPDANRGLEAAGLLIGGFAIVNLLSILVFEAALGSVHLAPPKILQDLLVALCYFAVVFGLLWVNKVPVDNLITGSALVTAVIAFSMQDTLGNIMGGLVLQLEKTVNVGDWVQIDNTQGRVKEIRWRHTSIETRNWDTIFYPNSMLMKGQVMLLGHRTDKLIQHRMWVYFNVDFRIPPSQVIQEVEAALRAEPIEGAAIDPPPNCITWEFRDSYINYAVRYWLTDLTADDPTSSRVRVRVYFALKRANIPLSIPAHALFVTEEGQKRKEEHIDRELQARFEALRGVELFRSFNDEELRTLAARMRYAPFTAGEVMTRQGAEAHWLYIITRGSGTVEVAADGVEHRVTTLHAGDFFGEMGMMLGISRTATVRAVEDTDCFRLDKAAFNDIIGNRPEIAENISHVMARRRVELEAVREEMDAETRRKRMAHAQQDIIARITSFFGLGDDARP